MSQSSGKLVWITGLAGAGKSSVAKEVFSRLKKQEPNTIYLDGDSLREILGGTHGYDGKTRLNLAMSYARLCAFLTNQGFNVVIGTISLFHSVHEYNSQNNSRYLEVLLMVSNSELERRNQKNLYKSGGADVVGLSMSAQLPRNPSLKLVNENPQQLQENVQKIMGALSAI